MNSSFPGIMLRWVGPVLLCVELVPAIAQDSPPHVPASATSQTAASQNTNSPEPAPESQPKAEPLSPWKILGEGVSTRSPLHRAEAVAALGTLPPNRRVLNLMEKALADKDPSVRELVARTLGEMHARAAIPQLRHALHDESPEVIFAAAKSLWAMGDHTGRDVFIQTLSGDRSSSSGLIKGELESTKKKLQDPKKLAILGAREAATSLFGPAGWGIKFMEEVTTDRSAPARAISAIMLGPDGTLDALHELQDALSDKNWVVRAAAAQALGTSRRRDQISFLQPLMQDEKPPVRYVAAASIIRLSSGAASRAADASRALKSDVRPALGVPGQIPPQ